jgi:hypothetical protein
MIVEFPAPECAEGSSAAAKMGGARIAFALLTQSSPPKVKYRVLRRPLRVSITGIGFFDRIHGQKGVAPNGIELHPVLGIGKAE